MKFILILLIILFTFLLINQNKSKLYLSQRSRRLRKLQRSRRSQKYVNDRFNYPSFSPSTRNMTYDLRCEPQIPKTSFNFMNSSISPHTSPRCIGI